MLSAAISCNIVATAATGAEVTTSNLRSGAGFDNLKASWGKALNIGGVNTQLDCTYDRNACKDYLNTASLSGKVFDKASDDGAIDYEVKKNFVGSKKVEVKLSALMSGTKVTADLDSDDQLTELNAQRMVTIGDREFDMNPSYLVKSQTARLKLASVFGKDTLKAQFDWETERVGASSYELGYERALADGKVISATLVPADKNLEIELVDSKFEKDATWTATANLPFADSARVVDNAKVVLKRAWAW
jgi:hypothetical protein